jgi:hypothetical protein
MISQDQFFSYWSYYLSIEDEFIRTNHYVEHCTDNSQTYSNEFSKLILIACSEIDNILKAICNEINGNGKHDSINKYAKFFCRAILI